MAINSFQIEDVVDKRTGEVRRRTKVKLADRNVALCTLSKCLGMQTDRLLLEASVEYRIPASNTDQKHEERVARVRELREKARREYLPRYLEMMQQANGSASVIDSRRSMVMLLMISRWSANLQPSLSRAPDSVRNLR